MSLDALAASDPDTWGFKEQTRSRAKNSCFISGAYGYLTSVYEDVFSFLVTNSGVWLAEPDIAVETVAVSEAVSSELICLAKC